MKKIISIALIVSILITSCKKDFIEKAPVSTISVDALYKTDKDFQDAVIGIYHGFRDPYQNFWQFGDLRGDDVQHDPASGLEQIRTDNFVTDNSDNLLASSWRSYYIIINRANVLLSTIETSDPAVVKNKARHKAETQFIRALAYFNLVRIFGDVPLLTTPITSEEAYKIGRDKVDKIYNELIIKDLVEAENHQTAKNFDRDL